MDSSVTYPTKMHELFKLQPNERAKVIHNGRVCEIWLDSYGSLFVLQPGENQMQTVRAIESFVLKPRLTEGHIRLLVAAHELHGAEWLAKDKEQPMISSTCIYTRKPTRIKMREYWSSGSASSAIRLQNTSPLCDLVSWEDEEPLNIIQVLKDSGIEVE